MTYFDKFKTSLLQIDYYIYALCEIDGNNRKPFYIGKGKGNRCLQHLNEATETDKVNKISKLSKDNRLGIDILRHSIKDETTAKLIEATCIDLLGVGELTNKVRGSGTNMGRASIEELHYLISGESITIPAVHRGIAFLLNDSYKSGMSELELFEVTRGIWHNPPKNKENRYAYATYAGLIKEVYEIHDWVQAGTQQYFTRDIVYKQENKRWEFIGRKAPQDIRDKYVGKVISKSRSYGNPFVEVGG
ncbi:hypothetical protein V8687_18040 [Shewanella baltica]|uniref:LEM-3-like GIY-YIG domain-containing protein n=1 Tax=Shewanella baltica TaxID=62322 RepID=UPI0030CFDD88